MRKSSVFVYLAVLGFSFVSYANETNHFLHEGIVGIGHKTLAGLEQCSLVIYKGDVSGVSFQMYLKTNSYDSKSQTIRAIGYVDEYFDNPRKHLHKFTLRAYGYEKTKTHMKFSSIEGNIRFGPLSAPLKMTNLIFPYPNPQNPDPQGGKIESITLDWTGYYQNFGFDKCYSEFVW